MGFLVPDSDVSRVFVGERHPQISAVRFQHRLLQALTCGGATIEAVTTPPIAPYPRSRHWWVTGAEYELSGVGVRGRQISGPNLPVVRLFVRLIQSVRHGLPALRQPCEGILVYSVHTPLLAAALVLKRLRRVPVFVFIPDLPTFMGGPSNPLKRLMKRIDDVLIRRLLGHTDGAFPITEGIGRDWLPRGPRYSAVEGVSDEAAAVLSGARSNGAYVFRGGHRPRLLYTGALSEVMTFAHAFHRSAIDASLMFMGGGEELDQLQKLSAVDPRIAVKPFTLGAEFAREVERADFLLNPRDPSWTGAAYSFPSKLFEYLQAGKPIISTRLPGIPADYFTIFRPVDLTDQRSFDASLESAVRVEEDPERVWAAAELLGQRLTSASVGAKLLNCMREWTA